MASDLMRWVGDYNIDVNSIVHIGAHLVQERDEYKTLGAEFVLWIEAMPWISEKASRILRDYPNQELLSALLWSETGIEKEFYVAGDNGSSSSVYKPYLISASHPEVQVSQKIRLKTTTLDELLEPYLHRLSTSNILVLDTQGAELKVLHGGRNNLHVFDYLVTEVSIRELYKNAPTLREYVTQIEKFGFTLLEAKINRATGWGDAIFIRSTMFQNKGFKSKIIRTGRYFPVRTLLRSVLVRLNNILSR